VQDAYLAFLERDPRAAIELDAFLFTTIRQLDLEELMDWLADVSDLTDKEALEELAAEGIDYPAVRARFEANVLPRFEAARRRQELHVVRQQRLPRSAERDWLAHVRSLGLSMQALVARIDAFQGAAVANRKLNAPTRADLEIMLADLMALEAEAGS
jgi:hypothetical protein